MTAPVLGVLTGVRDEARCLDALRAPPALIAFSGANAARAHAAARDLVARGATALVSVGLAGGLNAHARPGTLLLAHTVLLPDGGALPCDAAWTAALARRAAAAGVPLVPGCIAASDTLLDTPAAKRRLAERTGAPAVDMESHAVARTATATGLPFLVLRAVADGPDRAIPPAALAGVAADGSVRPLAVAARLVRAPWQLPALLGLARDSRVGLAALRHALERLERLA